jgi:hypothetical protein
MTLDEQFAELQHLIQGFDFGFRLPMLPAETEVSESRMTFIVSDNASIPRPDLAPYAELAPNS